MKAAVGFFEYSGGAGVLKNYEGFNKISSGKFTFFWKDTDIKIIENNSETVLLSKGCFFDKESENIDILQRNGNFAAFLYDKKKEELTLARDVLGSVPVYYYDDGRVFYFATHTALLKDFLLNKNVSFHALDSFFTHKAVTAGDSIYEKVYALKAGCKITKPASENFKVESFENINFTGGIKLNFNDASKVLKDIIASSLESLLKQKTGSAVLLSGGLDSNITASLAVKMGVKSVFSAKIKDNDFDESTDAKRAAAFYGMEYNEIAVDSFTYDDLYEIAETYEQPFADSSAYPMYKMLKEASASYKSFLTGDGADELFGGYLRYRAVKAAAAVPSFIKKPLNLAGKIFTAKAGDRSFLSYFKRFSSAMSSSICDINAQWYACFSDEEKKLLFKNNKTDFDALDKYKNSCLVSPSLNSIFLSDINFQLADCFNIKTFAPSEKFSIQVSSPFYNKAVLKFSESLPEKWKTTLFDGKIILKKAFNNDLPEFVVKKRKKGFGIPLNSWFRKECKDIASELLLSERACGRGYFDAGYVKSILDDHLSLKNNNGQKIWALCMFEMWNRACVDATK